MTNKQHIKDLNKYKNPEYCTLKIKCITKDFSLCNGCFFHKEQVEKRRILREINRKENNNEETRNNR